jgi:uncharacterized protein
MQTNKTIQFLRALSIPLLFCGVAVGLVALHAAIQRKAEMTSAAALQPTFTASLSALSNPAASVADLSAAAGKGDLAARVEMGRRLALGRDVARSEADALSYFRGIVSEYQDISAHDKRGPDVAAAFMELARLYKNGAPEANIEANPAQAFSFLHYAASYFGDPAAQVELAKLLLSGDGVSKSTRVAARWLLSASKKGYAPAQALLGNLLWRGADGVKRVAGDGLGLLAIARHNVLGEDKAWVHKMFETARGEALPVEILEANAFIAQESRASHFPLTSDILIKGERFEAADATAGLTFEPRGGSGEPKGAVISGTSKALSELGATPMGLPQSFNDPDSTRESKDAGILQMYRPQSSEVEAEAPPPVRYAGVSR